MTVRSARLRSVRRRRYIRMIRARAEAVKNISSVVEENDERGDRVVELDQFKSIISSYEEPLAEMRDSL